MEQALLDSDAIFIADSHFIAKRYCDDESKWLQSKTLLEGLENLYKNPPKQVFLMGDIANVLIGSIASSIDENLDLLNAILKLSLKSQVWWFEGNHDFNLAHKNLAYYLHSVKIIPRSKQPMLFLHNNKNIFLAHGDIFVDKKYTIYITCLNNVPVLKMLNLLNRLSGGKIYLNLAKKIHSKRIKQGNMDFETFAKNRIDSYMKHCKKYNLCDVDVIIEGHFHIGKQQNYKNKIYIALPSFYCKKMTFKLESAILN